MNFSRFLRAAAFALVICSTATAQVPKGHLVIIGGGAQPDPIKPTIIQLAGGPDVPMLTIGTATKDSQAAADKAADGFRKAGALDVTGIAPTREECNNPKWVKKTLKKVGSVYFVGGYQTRIVDTLRGTLFHEALKDLYMKGGVISGTSAGAAMMSEIMLTGKSLKKEKDKFRSIAPGTVDTAEGMGFLKGAVIDQHFIKRQRENRLFSVILEHPDHVAVGIDEATAIVVSEGKHFKVIGNSTVMVLEPEAGSVKTDKNDNFGAELKVRILLSGDTYTIPGIE